MKPAEKINDVQDISYSPDHTLEFLERTNQNNVTTDNCVKVPIVSSVSHPTTEKLSKMSRKETPPRRNICFFVANICMVNMFYMMLTAYTNGVVRTQERRFGFSSSQTGFLNSCNDIVHILLVVFVGYFGQRGNKPRIMCVTAMFSAVSGILNASPHFLFPDESPTHDNYINSYPRIKYFSNNSDAAAYRSTPSSVPFHIERDKAPIHLTDSTKFCLSSSSKDNLMREFHEYCPKEKSTVHPAFYVFMVSQLINGVGSSAIFTLSMAYIDENSPENKASLYLGAYTSLYSIGMVLGLFLSSLCLKLPENLLSGSTAGDQPFIGCWWLGYLVGGTGLGFFAFFLWFHPSGRKYKVDKFHGRSSDEVKSFTKRKHDGMTGVTFLTQIKDIPMAFFHLLRNKLYLVNLCVVVSEVYTTYGVFVGLVRYLEVHFNRTAAESSLIAGSLLAVSGILGGFAGGTIISRSRLRTKGGVKFLLCLNFILMLGLVVLINLGCPQVKMDMTVDPARKTNMVNNKCNADCRCPTTRTDYNPVCGSNNISYFSPCIAGCSQRTNETYFNCKCIFPNARSERDTADSSATGNYMGKARPGLCVESCALLIPFIATMFVVSLANTISKVPSAMITFRIVKDDERSFALGVNSFVLNLCGFIPGPIVYGKLIDSTCLLWQTTCNTTGACLLFDKDRLRQYSYGFSMVVEAITFACNFCLFLLIRKTIVGIIPLSRGKESIVDVNL